MGVSTIEAVVENGQIRLPADVHLPENAKVYVIVPDAMVISRPFEISSPQLVHRSDVQDFQMEIAEDR